MYYYKIYGLTVQSEIYLPEVEVLPNTTNFDVLISRGKVSINGETHPNCMWMGSIWWYCIIHKNQILFRSGDFNFEVIKGKKIVVETINRDYDHAKMRTYILGTAFGIINIQLGRVPIHGAVVKRHSSAMIISGITRAGKSTITDLLIKSGNQYLADDVSVADIKDGTPVVYPAYPQRKLCVDAALEQNFAANKFELVTEGGIEKYLIKNSAEWYSKELPIGSIIEIIPNTSCNIKQALPKLINIKGSAALYVILRNLYRNMFHMDGIKPDLMKKLLVIAEKVKVYQLIRPEFGYKQDCIRQILKNL